MGICHNHVGEVYFFGEKCPYCERLAAKGQLPAEKNPRKPHPKPKPVPKSVPRKRATTMGYPKKGDRVRAIGYWSGKEFDVMGTVEREGRRVRSGAVMGRIITDTGKPVWVPWSTTYITFHRVDE